MSALCAIVILLLLCSRVVIPGDGLKPDEDVTWKAAWFLFRAALGIAGFCVGFYVLIRVILWLFPLTPATWFVIAIIVLFALNERNTRLVHR